MDFKKRWCLLLTTAVLFVVLIILEKYSRCSSCLPECCGTTKEDQNLVGSQSQPTVADSSCKAELKSSGIVFDCITWEVRRNLTDADFELHPLNTTLSETGEDAEARKQTFLKIFHKRDWPADDPSYGGLKSSGPGAMMRNAQGAIAALHSLITMLKSHLKKSVISILDVPCGDLQWMSRFLDTRTDIKYTGADIVPEIIKHHQKKFRRFQNAEFIELDVVLNPVNRSFDLIFCRNLLQHLWMDDAFKVLQQFSESGSTFLLTTTFHDTDKNIEVEKHELGGRRSSYNLEIPPFLLGPPICTCYDWNIEHLSLWSLPLMQKHI